MTALVGAAAGLLSRRFYYGNDDLLQFTAAKQDGLSWSYLSLNVWQHFAPFNRFAHWVVLRFSDLSPTLGLGLTLVNYAALLAASLWLMTELRLSTVRRAVALILIGLSVSLTESGIWFDPGMHILAAIAVTFAVCAAHVRGVNSGARRWHVLALFLFVLGQTTQERPVFALPLLILVDVLLLWRALPWAERLRRLLDLRLPLAALIVAAAAIVASLRAFLVVDDLDTPSWSVTGRTMLSALTNYVAPSLANLPREAPASMTGQLVVLGCLVAGGILLARVRAAHNAGPLLFVAAVFVLYYGFLKFSPILSEATIDFNAQRLHNAAYVTVPAVIALAHVRLRTPVRVRPPVSGGPGRVTPARRRALQIVGCLLLAGGLVVTNNAYLGRHWAETADARAYLDAVRAGADQWSAPGRTVIPLWGHPALATAWSQQLGRLENLLPLVRKAYTPGPASGRLVLIDDRGSVQPAALRVVRRDVDVVRGACSASGRTVRKGSLSFPVVQGDPRLVRLSYVATEDLDLYVTAGWGHDVSLPWRLTRLPGGSHTRLIPIDARVVGALDLEVITKDAGICVQDADIVQPLIGRDGDDECRAVDWHGRPRAVVPCP